MDTERDQTLKDASLPRLVALFLSPFALWSYQEKVASGLDEKEAAGVHYRNNLFIFSRIDEYIGRWACVIWGCFVVLALLTFAVQSAYVYLAVSAVMIGAIVHVAILGIYRHVLNDRIDRYANIIGVERPKARDEPKEFPRDKSDKFGGDWRKQK